MQSRAGFTTLCLFFILTSSAVADSPDLISIQGKLTNASGDPFTAGAKTFIFTLYGGEVSPVPSWTETQVITTDADGLWSANLGAILPLDHIIFSNANLWLEVIVDAVSVVDTLPRVRMVSSPYAHRVGGLGGASGGNVTPNLTVGTGSTATGDAAFAVGSVCHASGDYATVTGGGSNLASGEYSVVSGGRANSASGNYSTIPGGDNNEATGNYSFAAGRRAKARHLGSFVLADHSTADFASTAEDQFLIRATGGVGIGVDSPFAALHVNPGPDGNSLYFNAGAQDIVWHTSQPLQFGQWDGAVFTERLRVTAGGRLGIGATTISNALTLPDIATVEGRGLAHAWNVYSSRRWKDNIATITGALEKVSRLRGVTYVHKSDATPDIGLIAEEVGEVIPEVVQYEENGVDARSVDYSRLVAVLIEGMKEQQAEIETLKKRLDQMTP